MAGADVVQLREVFMQAPVPIAVLQGPDHLYTLSNPAYDGMVGRPTLGKRVLEAFTQAEVGNFVPILDRVFRTGETITIHEAPLRLVNADGVAHDQFIDATYQAYRSPTGEIIGVMAFHNDVTLAVRARMDAEAMARARDEFLAMLGHELRNPIAPIATATVLMKMRGDQYPKEREVIERQVNHLGRLVDDLLDISRVARGRIELQRKSVRIVEVIETALETVGPLLDSRKHQLDLDIPSTDTLTVEGDPARLAQVFCNLLGNAAKYTESGGHIAVRALRDGPSVKVTIADNGPGIASELLPRIFEMFVQGQQRSDRKHGGLGLGLALVRNLVTLHGGTVDARNLEAGGTELIVRLPALVLDATESAPAAHPTPGHSPAKHPRRILVVDDNQDHAELLAEFLETLGHTTLVAYDGPSALEKLADFDADTALLDLGLPGMDGFELVKLVHETAPHVRRAIAVTGYGQPRDRELTKAAGFDHHLTKPVDLDALAELIEA